MASCWREGRYSQMAAREAPSKPIASFPMRSVTSRVWIEVRSSVARALEEVCMGICALTTNGSLSFGGIHGRKWINPTEHGGTTEFGGVSRVEFTGAPRDLGPVEALRQAEGKGRFGQRPQRRL